MRIVLSFVLVLVSAMSASAQAKAEVKVEELMSGLYSVTVQHPAFEGMCQALAKRVEAGSDVVTLRINPKVLPPSRARQMGEIWTVGSRGKMVEVPWKELAHPLWGVRGGMAGVPYLGTCYLKDNYFHSTEDVSFILDKKVDADAFARLFR